MKAISRNFVILSIFSLLLASCSKMANTPVTDPAVQKCWSKARSSSQAMFMGTLLKVPTLVGARKYTSDGKNMVEVVTEGPNILNQDVMVYAYCQLSSDGTPLTAELESKRR